MKIKSYLLLIGGVFICAFTFNLFMIPHHISPGGVSGIAIILEKYTRMDKSLLILIMSLFLLVVSFIFLGSHKTVNSIVGTLLFPLFVYLTGLPISHFYLTIENTLLCSIFGGVLFGFGLGLIYKEDFTSGGTDIISQIMNKYGHISMGISHFLVEFIIIGFNGLIYGFNTFMYSLITLYLMSIVVDKVMIGISTCKSFYIVTKEPSKVNDYILNTLKHGVTIINGRGAYSNEEKKILMTVIPTRDYYKLKEGLKRIDNEAFFVVCDSYEVNGGI